MIKQLDEKQFLNNLTQNYLDYGMYNRYYDMERKTIVLKFTKYLSKKDKLLELGCSTGLSTVFLAELVDEVVCVEAVEEFISQAKNLLMDKGTVNVKFINSLFEEVKFDNEYDCVIANFVLEHVENVDAVLQMCYNALKPGGLLLATVPNAQAFSRQMAVEMGIMNSIYDLTENDHRFGHRRTFDKVSFENVITKNKFKIIQSGGNFFKPFADFQLEKMVKAEIIGVEQFEGLAKMGDIYPQMCHGIYVVAKKSAVDL